MTGTTALPIHEIQARPKGHLTEKYEFSTDDAASLFHHDLKVRHLI
jgi:hypothetical protein